jgi:hypothetical protein
VTPDADEDADAVTAALAARVGAVTFLDRSADEVTATLVDAVAAWAADQGWRVYRRARSVVPLPPPYEHKHSTLDVACARPVGPPVVIEVDRTDRRRTVDKLLAEAAAGRVAIWLRWGTGAIAPPPAPIRLVTCAVTARSGRAGADDAGARGRRFDRTRVGERPPPRHSDAGTATSAEPLA